MMRGWIAVVALISAVLVGCGGVEADTDPETLGGISSALSTCSTTCPNGTTLSCTGTSCSASDGVSVQCDGTYQYCPPSPSCAYENNCEVLLGQACMKNTTRTCCDGYGGTYTCPCYQGKWMCPL
jgi:hypothetical protein